MPQENNLLRQGEFIEKLEQIKKLADQCILEFSGTSSKLMRMRKSNQETKKAPTAQFDFGLNARAFVKKYGKHLSGPKIFVLILTYAAKGKINKQVSLLDIEKLWGKMEGLIGMKFNGAYPIRAKDNGWIESTKRGFYTLADSWKGAFKYE